MASVGLLALLDDITTLLDDVAVLSKVAAKKTAGVIGDDLALNAEQVSGITAARELPVVWAVAKGSLRNKLILVPMAILLSAWLPWVIPVLLILGGLYLCFEGVEKVLEVLWHRKGAATEAEAADHLHHLAALSDAELKAYEQTKIKNAIRTDFILSAEIIVIALGVVQNSSLWQQFVVISVIALGITVVVYGLVGLIVKLDDIGLALMKVPGVDLVARAKRRFGYWLLAGCPYLLRTLSVLGTAAMFLVGGGILLHYFPGMHHLLAPVLAWSLLPHGLTELGVNVLLGLVSGVVVLLLVSVARKVHR